MQKIANLWKRKSRNTGKPFLSGSIDRAKLEDALNTIEGDPNVLVFPNGYKKGRRDPDCSLKIAEQQKELEEEEEEEEELPF